MKRRRSGAVISIALNANRQPTIALIAANRLVDWSLGLAAWRSERSSASAGATVMRSPTIRRSSLRTSSSVPGRAPTSNWDTRPGLPLIRCAKRSDASAA